VTFLEQAEFDVRSILSAEFSHRARIKVVRDSIETTVDLRGIFDRTYTESNGEGLPVNSRNSRISIAANEWLEKTGFKLESGEADFKSDVEIFGDESVNGVHFRISTVEPDGQGIACLYLIRAGANSTTHS